MAAGPVLRYENAVPGFEVDAAIAGRIRQCLHRDASGIAQRCYAQLSMIGSIGKHLLRDPVLLELLALTTNDSDCPSPLTSLAQWLRAGAIGTVCLRVDPFIVKVGRGERLEDLRIVEARTPRFAGPVPFARDFPESTQAAGGAPLPARMEIELGWTEAALATFERIVDPHRRRIADTIVSELHFALVRAGFILAGIEPLAGIPYDLLSVILRDTCRRPGRRTITVEADGMALSFELDPFPGGQPCTITDIFDTQAVSTRYTGSRSSGAPGATASSSSRTARRSRLRDSGARRPGSGRLR